MMSLSLLGSSISPLAAAPARPARLAPPSACSSSSISVVFFTSLFVKLELTPLLAQRFAFLRLGIRDLGLRICEFAVLRILLALCGCFAPILLLIVTLGRQIACWAVLRLIHWQPAPALLLRPLGLRGG